MTLGDFVKLAGTAVVGVADHRARQRGQLGAGQNRRSGSSQATTMEPWPAQFNKDIIAEAKKHAEIELIITDGENRTEKQVADVENLIRQEVDASSRRRKSAGLTGVVEGNDAKIPVFVLDRNMNTDRYTQFVGGTTS